MKTNVCLNSIVNMHVFMHVVLVNNIQTFTTNSYQDILRLRTETRLILQLKLLACSVK